MKTLFYKPENGYAADFILFYKDGTYYLFYLHDYRDTEKYGEGTPWYLITTRDFVHFKEYGEVLPRGTKDEQDLFVFTGCVLEADKEKTGYQYHIFYTGHNYYLVDKGVPQQAVMHAVSDDLIHWEKRPEEKFFAPSDRYEPHDWRDPFVFWDDEAGEYRMLTAARVKDGPSRRRGVTALSGSKDLKNWRVYEPFYAPGLYFTHECPDYFKMGDRYYHVFSEFTGDFRTQYRVGKNPYGPWETPRDPVFDTRGLYAAKTAGDGKRRFLFGETARIQLPVFYAGAGENRQTETGRPDLV